MANFFLMNVFFALKGSIFLLLFPFVLVAFLLYNQAQEVLLKYTSLSFHLNAHEYQRNMY